jgi:hypothetical protein
VDEDLDGPTQDLERTREARDAWTAPRSHLYRTSNLTSVHAVARQVETVMLEENSDWFLTTEGHDVVLHDAVRPATCDETSLQDERRHHCRRARIRIRSGSGIRADNGEESPP